MNTIFRNYNKTLLLLIRMQWLQQEGNVVPQAYVCNLVRPDNTALNVLQTTKATRATDIVVGHCCFEFKIRRLSNETSLALYSSAAFDMESSVHIPLFFNDITEKESNSCTLSYLFEMHANNWSLTLLNSIFL